MSHYRLYFDDNENSRVIPKASSSNHTTSLPNSPEKLNLTVVERVRSFENLNSASKYIGKSKFKMSQARLDYNPLKGTRTSLKGWVTRHRNELHILKTNNQLTKENLHHGENSINEIFRKLEENEFKIDEVYAKHGVTELNLGDMPSREPEATLTFEFIKETRLEITALHAHVGNSPPPVVPGAASLDAVLAAVSNKSVSRVSLECKVFDSDKAGKFEFRDWYAQFKAVMSSWPNCESKLKLAYLKTKVEGTAKLYIVNLEQTNDNYQIALNILEGKYLDKAFIKDELFKELLSSKSEFHLEYEKTKVYLQKTMNNLEDLNEVTVAIS